MYISHLFINTIGDIFQLVEYMLCKHTVTGSSPVISIRLLFANILLIPFINIGKVAEWSKALVC